MKINQQIMQINRSFLICFIISASTSALVAQLLSNFENYLITSITIGSGYVVFFVMFSIIFYVENKTRYKSMQRHEIKKELIKLVTSFGIGEIFYLSVRWFSLFYFLEWHIEPFVSSLISEIISMAVYMIVVSVFLKAAKIF